MADTTAEFLIRGRADTRDAEAGLDRVDAAQKKVGQSAKKAAAEARKEWDNFLTGFSGGKIPEIVGKTGLAFAGLGIATDQVATRAVKFDSMMKNLPYSIDAASRATQGLVSKTELMRLAITANRFGVAKTSAEFAKLAEVGTKLSVSIGQDAVKGVEDLTIGMSRGSPKILDNLGITVRITEANKKYADSLGITVDALTEEQKVQALANAALEDGIKKANEITIAVDGAAGGWVRLKTRIGDTADLFSSKVVGAMDAVGEELAEEAILLQRMERYGMSAAEVHQRTWSQITDVIAGLNLELAYTGALMEKVIGEAKQITDAEIRKFVLAENAAGIHRMDIANRSAQAMIDKKLRGGGGGKRKEGPFDDDLRLGALMGDIGPQAGMREDFDKRREQAELYRKEQEAMIPILERDMGDRQAILDIETRRAELALAESENEEIRFDREAEIERLRIEAIDLQISKTYELGARRELEFQKEIVQHQRRMRVKSFEESQEKKKQALIQDSMRAAVATGNAIIGISEMIGASDRAQSGMKAGLEGILAAVDFAAAATAYATLNIPQGVALTASGAMHVAAGIQAAAFAGSGGGRSGGRSMSMGPAFNPGGVGGSPNGGSGSGRPGLPGSAPGPGGSHNSPGGGGMHIHFHTLGIDDEDSMALKARRALKKAGDMQGPL